MTVSLLILIAIALPIVIIGVSKGVHERGFMNSWNILIDIAPLVLVAILTTGFMQALIPHDSIKQWIGAESGQKGILIGTAAGMITPGGAYVSLPFTMASIRAGADIGFAVAYLTSWSIWMISRLPIEIGLLGWKFTAIRLIITGLLPIFAGTTARILFSWLK